MCEPNSKHVDAEKPGRANGEGTAGITDERAECGKQPVDPSAKAQPPAHKKSDLWAAVGDSLKLQKEAPPLRAVSRDQDLPLSWAQQQLWIIQQADPDSVA